MSKEKPKSIYGDGGRVTESITWSEEGYRIVEHIDISTNGATGLTKEISVFLPGAPFSSVNPLDPGNEHILEIIQNSSIREQKYHTKMNEVRVDALENGTSSEFEQSLKDNGTYEAIAGAGSINDIEIKGEKTRNNEKIKREEDAAKTKLQNFQKSIEVSGDYTYPVDMKVDDGQDYIFFEQFEYLPPQNVPRKGDQEALKTDLGTVLRGGVGRGKNIKKPHGTCKLPIPNKLAVSNGVNWGEGRANAVELSAFQSADAGIQGLVKKGNVLEALAGAKDQVGGALNVLKDDFTGRSERTGENINAGDILSATLARSVLGSIGINVDVDQFITRQTGAAINPNLELLFGGPQLRSFSFNFTFAPNDDIEAKEVRQIQRWFRQGMLPSRRRASQSSGSALFLASPNVFRICYKNRERRIKGLNIIKICALTSCQIDFTPDGTYQSYDDVDGVSMPVRSTMGISFTELTPVFKDDYAENVESPSMLDLGTNVQGTDAIDENDIGI